MESYKESPAGLITTYLATTTIDESIAIVATKLTTIDKSVAKFEEIEWVHMMQASTNITLDCFLQLITTNIVIGLSLRVAAVGHLRA